MEFLIGIVVGYLVVSLCESFFHRVIQHATKGRRRLYRKLGWLGWALLRAWYTHHVAHHRLTFRRNHVTQFSDDDERSRLDRLLVARGKPHVIVEDYGSRIGPHATDHLLYVAPTLPIFTVVCWVGGMEFTCGALIPFIAWPMLAQFVHPYLHMEEMEVTAKASPLIKAFAASPYFRALVAHHWLHHRYENYNYNLLLGGDRLLGVHRAPTADDLAEMRALGLTCRSS